MQNYILSIGCDVQYKVGKSRLYFQIKAKKERAKCLDLKMFKVNEKENDKNWPEAMLTKHPVWLHVEKELAKKKKL